MEWHTPNGLMLYDGEYQEDLKHGTGWLAVVVISCTQASTSGRMGACTTADGRTKDIKRSNLGSNCCLQDGQRSGSGTEMA